MIPADVQIIGIVGVELKPGHSVCLRLLLSDGSIGATHWRLDSLRDFVGLVEGPPAASGVFPRLN